MLSKELQEKILKLVKKEPCLVQDISQHIGKSWVATEGYVERISKDTGLIRTKAFRKGTKGAVKVVYWNYSESVQDDEVKERLFQKIKLFASKKEFDPLEIFQFAKDKRSNAIVEFKSKRLSSKHHKNFLSFLKKADSELLCFSGNISWISIKEGKESALKIIEQFLKKRGVLKIICRIDIASMKNIRLLEPLMKEFSGQIEIRHSSQPVRGFIMDSKIARFKDEKKISDFKEGELSEDLYLFYELFDIDWVEWCKNVFWYLFRNSIGLQERIKALDKLVF